MNMNEQEMQCSTHCPFFVDSQNTEWEYDKETPYIKRRKTPAKFKCAYDGHPITNWYSPCPKKLEDFLKEKEKEND